jgi:hypothetical protein
MCTSVDARQTRALLVLALSGAHASLASPPIALSALLVRHALIALRCAWAQVCVCVCT